MTSQYKKFRDTLDELFMLDHAELDFGIYRIMNQKRADIADYLDNRLQEQVSAELAKHSVSGDNSAKEELDRLVKTLSDAGMNPDEVPKVQELKEKLKNQVDTATLETEVYSHLTTFFRRYYDGGDFMSMRRYKKDVYAIPYEGEEVKLHWANADQYYIKTSEYFQNYTFKSGDLNVTFSLRDASTEQNNNKAQNDKERRFKICEEDCITVNGNNITVWFTYEPMPKSVKQPALQVEALNKIKSELPTDLAIELLRLMPTEKNKNRTLLEKHLNDYVSRNSFDYFIHKDLGGFLTRELEFYIKNEVFFIDDIDTAAPDKFMARLSQVKTMKVIGCQLIGFLAQLEEFQKKLWLKKKFVVESNYCITLDRVPEELYKEIASNDAQREEWVRLFSIDEIKGDSGDGGLFASTVAGYSEPLSIDFLEQNQFLVLDTAFFSDIFKQRLLSSIDNVDEQLDGTLINSENFQALNLLQEKYREQVKCIYIDPPYNTGSDGFTYKDSYQHSSWLSMMQDRMQIAKNLMVEDASTYMSINENEVYNLEKLSNLIYGEDMYLTTFAVKVRHEDRILKGDKDFHEVFESLLVYRKSAKHKTLKRTKDNTSNAEYMWEVTTEEPSEIITLGNKNVEVYFPGSYTMTKRTPDFKYAKRISIRGSIKEGNSSGRFYTGNIEPLSNKYENCIFKVPDMGDDEVPYRYFWKQSIESGRKNGDYFQGVPQNRKDETYIPFPNFIDMEKEFNNCADEGGVAFPGGKKPITFVKHCLQLARQNSGNTILDYFAGSGSTGHSVIDINRLAQNEEKLKYMLVEMGTYFDNVTKPRVQKVIYSKDWKDGKPVSREGSSHCFKYVRLESYEDTLNNLKLETARGELKQSDEFNDGYTLGYMLDTETRGSLLNTQWFVNPFDVKLKITRQNELQERNIDLIETFNYLIGLNVEAISYPKDGLCVVEGTTRRGDKTLVLWRNCCKIDNKELNETLRRLSYNTLDTEFDQIYVNGDNTLQNQRRDDEHWKVNLIEETFFNQMFEN